jgi:hypothetical protein
MSRDKSLSLSSNASDFHPSVVLYESPLGTGKEQCGIKLL